MAENETATEDTPTITLTVEASHTDLFNFFKKAGNILATRPSMLGENGLQTYRKLTAAFINSSSSESLKGIISGALEINPASEAPKPILKIQAPGDEKKN